MSPDRAEPAGKPDAEPAPDPGVAGALTAIALRRAGAMLMRALNETLRPEGLRPSELQVLSLVGATPLIRQNRAAAALGIMHTNFVPLLDGLAARGLIERRRVVTDRRAAALALTPEGAAVLARIEPRLREEEARLASLLGPGETGALRATLLRLANPEFGQ